MIDDRWWLIACLLACYLKCSHRSDWTYTPRTRSPDTKRNDLLLGICVASSCFKVQIPMAAEILQRNGWDQAQEFGNLGNLGAKNEKNIFYFTIKIIMPNMLARFRSVGKTLRGPIWSHFSYFFDGPEKCQKQIMQCFCYFPWWSNGCYSTGLEQWSDLHVFHGPDLQRSRFSNR